MKNKNLFFISIVLFNMLTLPFVLAEEDEDVEIFGLELEKVLNLGSGILATILFILTLIAYSRTDNKKLIYVSIAFALFAIKGFLTSHELFFSEWSWVDPTASALNFIILLTFFFGIIR